MNEVDAFLRATATWLLGVSLSATLLAAMVWLLQRGLGRVLTVRWTYALWLLVLVRLLIPFNPPSRLSAFNWLQHPATSAAPVAESARPIPATALMEPAPTITTERPSHGDLEHSWDLQRWWPRLWSAGVLLFLLLIIVQQLRLARDVARAECAGAAIDALVSHLSQTLGVRRRVRVLITDLISTPALMGWWRPRLLLPRLHLAGMSLAELGWVIRHELVHVRRHDVLLNWVLILAQALHWFNPVVWWALRRLRAERELVCDETVLRGRSGAERQAYGSALIRLLENIRLLRPPPLLVPILSQKKQIKRRIAMIAKSHSSRYAWLVAIPAGIALACLTFTRAAETPAPRAPTDLPQAPPAATTQADREKNVLEHLRAEMESLEVQIRKAEGLRDELLNRFGPARASNYILDQLEVQRLEAVSEEQQSDLLLQQWEKLSHGKLRQAALTILPDPTLQRLLEKEAEAEQQLATLESTFDRGHPEVKTAERTLKTIHDQVESRLEGLSVGLQTKRDLARKRRDQLSRQVEEERARQVAATIQQQPYQRADRDLKILQEIRDRLMKRTLEEQINQKLPPSARLGRSDPAESVEP